MDNEQKELVQRCIRNDRNALRHLYNLYASRMYGICLRYSGSGTEAEEMFLVGFSRVYHSIHLIRSQDSLDEWIRNEFLSAISGYLGPLLKRDQDFCIPFQDETTLTLQDEEAALSKLSVKEILNLIRDLPPGYRIVLNMYSIEGYSHFEIATKLGIGVNTSKSQLHRAKNLLRKKLANNGVII
jgi:RNA polymerase sigma-70 factor (ECF subfamily)